MVCVAACFVRCLFLITFATFMAGFFFAAFMAGFFFATFMAVFVFVAIAEFQRVYVIDREGGSLPRQ